MAWQPIETAPKDGTQVLFFGKSKLWVGNWFRYSDEDGEESCFVMSALDCAVGDCYCTEWETNPTHWQPLPAPPQGE